MSISAVTRQAFYKATALIFATLLINACTSVPFEVQERTLSMANNASSHPACHPKSDAHVLSSRQKGTPVKLAGNSIRLVNWNTFKAGGREWQQTLAKYTADADLVTLQEVMLNEMLEDSLNTQQLKWMLAITFHRYGKAAGLLTASRATPLDGCVVRVEEPAIKLPKAALITRYAIEDSTRQLMLVNIHAINFTLDTEMFAQQLTGVLRQIEAHDGPLIVTGDFNTWKSERQLALERLLVSPLALHKVGFDHWPVKTAFGHTLDHVYYRGLQVQTLSTESGGASDHNPMFVTFRLGSSQG